MTSYAITATGIEHYADALGQFEHLLGRLTGKEAQQATHGELEAMVQTEGSELLRRWVDDPEATPDDLDALATKDEAAWIAEREAVLLYR